MNDDDTLHDNVLRVLNDAPEPMGIGAIAGELNLSSKAETVALAAQLHSLVKEGSIAAERAAGVKGRPFYYRQLAPGETPVPPPRKGKARKQVSPKAQPEPLQAAITALEKAIEALVPDPNVLALVRALVSLKAK
jgi:predicted ArsR family transcriptional regulator